MNEQPYSYDLAVYPQASNSKVLARQYIFLLVPPMSIIAISFAQKQSVHSATISMITRIHIFNFHSVFSFPQNCTSLACIASAVCLYGVQLMFERLHISPNFYHKHCLHYDFVRGFNNSVFFGVFFHEFLDYVNFLIRSSYKLYK